MESMAAKGPKTLSELQDESKYYNISNENIDFYNAIIGKYIFVWLPFDRVVKCVTVNNATANFVEFTIKGKVLKGRHLPDKREGLNRKIAGGPFFIPKELYEVIVNQVIENKQKYEEFLKRHSEWLNSIP